MKRPPVYFADSLKKAKKVLDAWYKEDKGRIPTATDTEFESDGTCILMSLCWESRGQRYVIEAPYIFEVFGDHMTHHRTRLIMHNYGADANVFYKLRMDTDPAFFADTMVTGWLVDENLLSHDLKSQSWRFLNWKRRMYQHLFAYVPPGKKKPIVMSPRQVMYDLPEDALHTHTAAEWRELMLNYNGDDSASTKALFNNHYKFLKKIGYWKSYIEIDQPFTITLMRCEERGVRLDIKRLEAIRRLVTRRIHRSVHSFRALVDKPNLNLNSDPQKKKLLFEELKWPLKMIEDRNGKMVPDPMFMTKGGKRSKPQPKTNKEALAWYADEHGFILADILMNYNRENTKEKTFLKGLLLGVSKDKRLRSHFNQIGADTGRISSRKQTKLIVMTVKTKRGVIKQVEKRVKVGANLQNIPARKEKDPDGIRGAFIAPRKGQITARGYKATEEYSLIVADYSGFELCMMIFWVAKLGIKNAKMLEVMLAYKSPSACHAFTTISMYADTVHTCDDRCIEMVEGEPGKWFHKDEIGRPTKVGKKYKLGDVPMDAWKIIKKIAPDQYTLSKNNNFNLLYGGSPSMMARLRGLDFRDPRVLRECEQQFEEWNNTYPEVGEYQSYMVRHGYKHGWVPTISGRRANVADLLESGDDKMVGHGERKCMNTPCQGSAADIVKDAMNRIENDEELNSYDTKARIKIKARKKKVQLEKYERAVTKAQAFSLLFPVHDEIIAEAATRVVPKAKPRMVHLMKQPFKKEIPFELDVEAMVAYDWLSAKG